MTDNRHHSGHSPQPDNGTDAPQTADAAQAAAGNAENAANQVISPATDQTASPATGFCRAITAAFSVHIPEAGAEAYFAELKAQLPSRTARRMSRLGLMLSHLIGQTGISEDTVVLYGSMLGEARTLESYLASFPHPSPLGFQSSIHPGGVEQALIFRQQPVREFFPVTASENLPLSLFRTVSQCGHAKRILLLGGEECGSWLQTHGLAADTNFAFALLLELPEQSPAPLGWLRLLEPQATAEDTAAGTVKEDRADPATQQRKQGATLLDLSTELTAREGIDFCHPDEGHWSIVWHHTA